MSFIYRNLVEGEQIVYMTRKHVIIFFLPLVCTLLALFFSGIMHNNPMLTSVGWAPWAVALLFWLYSGLEYATSEFAVTNKRIMMREGFFNRHATEMRLASIAQVNIDQGMFGQMLDYGTVSINAMGAYDSFTIIAHPTVFQKQVNEQLFKLTGG